jgi:choline dehydrogenase
MAMEICATEPLAGYSPEVLMGPTSLSDEDIVEKSRANMQTLYHPVGTCAIDAVVDRELRVLGVDGLRVVDASVMPSVPRGNTNAPTIALAERASDLIRGKTPLGAPAEAAAPTPA